jgi:hypothetical protein
MKPKTKLKLCTHLASLILLSSLLGVGCAPSIREALNSNTLDKPVSRFSPIKVDVEASEIIWNHPVQVHNFKPRQLRREIAQSLEEAMNGQRGVVVGERGYIPSRYLLEVHEIEGQYTWAFLPCIVYLTLIGCPTHSLHADITLTLEYQGKIYTTSNEGSATFNLYSFLSFGGQSEVSPVADAMRKAIRRLAQQIRNGSVSQLRLEPLHKTAHSQNLTQDLVSSQAAQTRWSMPLSSIVQGGR